ncbi:hypothetical protein B7486_37635 [cyanobacterium TDX16]|nr:hypothetical protein B7486_37635 [cyanobacterium TDX16]
MASRRIALLVARRACRRLEWELREQLKIQNFPTPHTPHPTPHTPHPTPHTPHPTPYLLLTTSH